MVVRHYTLSFDTTTAGQIDSTEGAGAILRRLSVRVVRGVEQRDDDRGRGHGLDKGRFPGVELLQNQSVEGSLRRWRDFHDVRGDAGVYKAEVCYE